MSIQDKLSAFHINIKRKLFDFNVSNLGVEVKVIRLKTTESRYGDEEIEVINDDLLTVNIDLPADLPLTRLRDSVLDAEPTPSSVFLYDILPIEGYAKLEDLVEKGDILIVRIFFDLEKPEDCKFFILRVSEVLGNLSNRYMVRKHFQCSPHTIALTQAVQDIVDTYKTQAG